MFSTEATFHLNGIVTTHNCRIWGNQPLQGITDHQTDMPKVKILHHLTFLHSGSNCDKLHYTVTGWSILTFWKYCPSLFKLLFSIQMDQKKWFASITSKITGSNFTGLFPLGLCEEYYLPGKYCRSLKSATWHEWWLQQ